MLAFICMTLLLVQCFIYCRQALLSGVVFCVCVVFRLHKGLPDYLYPAVICQPMGCLCVRMPRSEIRAFQHDSTIRLIPHPSIVCLLKKTNRIPVLFLNTFEMIIFWGVYPQPPTPPKTAEALTMLPLEHERSPWLCEVLEAFAGA